MRYPTTFQAPKFSGTSIIYNQQNVVLLLPPTPSDFQVEPIGVVLKVTPTSYPDRRIDLELDPKVTDFEGFINYGSTVYQGIYLIHRYCIRWEHIRFNSRFSIIER